MMSEAADGQPKVKALVFIASFLLEPGDEHPCSWPPSFPVHNLVQLLHPVPVRLPDGSAGNDLYIKQEEFRRVFAADVPRGGGRSDGSDPAAHHIRGAGGAVATRAAWKTIPSWNMVTTQDLAVPAESMWFMGARANAQTVEVNASHAVPVSQPGAVADLITTAAVAVRG